MNIIKKFLMTVFIVNILVLGMYFNSFKVLGATDLSTLEDSATTFIENGKGQTQATDLTTFITNMTGEFKGLGQILTVVGAGILVAVTSYMGIQYIMAPPDKQAALKQQLIGIVVATIVIFGAYGIWSAVLNVVSNF